jgi:aspartate/methionine/tyrosine aminotransferase
VLPVPTRLSLVEESKITALVDTARDREGVIKLWVGEPDLPTPDFIHAAAREAMAAGETRYTYALGIPGLRVALSRYHARHWGVNVPAGRFCPTAGGMNAIMQALQAATAPGDEVLYPSPAWPNLTEAIRLVGAVPRRVIFDRSADGRFTLDLDKLFSAVTPKTAANAINTPSNPTGWRMPLEQMIELRDFARARGIWILADEVYAHFCFDGTIAPSFLQICDPDDRLLVANTFSKNWAMTGWRVGWVVFPEGFDRHFDNLSQFNTTGVATFLQHAAIRALDEGDAFIDTLRERTMASGRMLAASLSQVLGRNIPMPDGTFYLMADVGRFGSGMTIARRLLKEAGVGVAPGDAFGAGGEDCIRICFAVAPETAAEAARRIAACLASPSIPMPERALT